MKNELWVGHNGQGVRFAVRTSPSGERKMAVCATGYPNEEAWLSVSECERIILAHERGIPDELRFHPEGFGLLSFDVTADYLGIDHHCLYQWTKDERACALAFFRLFVNKTKRSH